ncbi:MAG: efflux RND transporter permease subunit [Acidobacteria bacterium]|nr:efflux RND transporter permease subunit [Acidobacteriota bacterium]
MSLPEFSTRYPVTITMATFAVVLLGWISLDGLGTDLLPNVETPVITVDLRVPGKSPQEMEERYTRRLERDISTVSGVDRVYSITRSGQAVVVAEFNWDTDMDFALLDVQKRMGAYGTDDEIETLDVTQEDPQALPVARIAVSSPDYADLDELFGAIDTLVKPRLEALDGVASAEIEGDAEKEIRVILDPYLLEAFGLTDSTVVQRIQQANQDVSGGRLEEGDQSYQVKGLGRFTDITDIENLIVGERAGSVDDAAAAASGAAAGVGAGPAATTEDNLRVPVYVKDVALVVLEYAERETIVRLNGVECLGIAIYKEADASTVDVVQTVLADLEQLALDLPNVQFTVVENQARFIESAVQEVETAALFGALLAVGVLLLFLRSITVTLVIGLAIPISILATFTLMYFQDLTLNIMTLGGLALGAGMLVDNAIVVIENIYRRLELGADPYEASAKGASEVGVAILASTLTTVSVFLPIVYVQGLVGELFKEQAWTVAFSLLSSLVVAMTVVPMISSRLLKQRSAGAKPKQRRWYRAGLSVALDHKLVVFVLLAIVAGGTYQLALTIQMEFIPREDRGLFSVDVALPEGSRLEMTDRVAVRVGSMIQELGGDDVVTVYARSGQNPARVTNVTDPSGPNRTNLSVALSTGPRRSIGQMVEAIDRELAEIPGLEVKYELQETALQGVLGAEAAPLQLEIIGDDLDTLRRLTAEMATLIEELPAIYNVRTSFQGGQPEIDLNLRDDVIAAFGLTPQSLIADLERRLSGEIAGELSKNQRSRDIRVGFEDVTLSELRSIRIDTAEGAILTLGDIADPRVVEGPREILREDQRRIGRISGYLVEGAVLSEAIGQVEGLVSQVALPVGYSVEIGGEERQRAESFASLGFALGLAVILVYMVMASLFESILHPFTVMLTVPFAGVGVVVAFWALGEPLSIMAYIGVIMLGGIAVNDAIILVDHVNHLRATMPIREAVVQGAQDRFRPILMTSATTVLALSPMAIGVGEGAQMRAPMAIAVIGGLVTSTLLTLVIIPVVYETVELLRRVSEPVGATEPS